MVRVLQIVHSMGMGGIETFLMNIYRNIDKEKVQFDFLLSSKEKGIYEDEIEKMGGKIYRVPPRRDGLLKNRKALKKFFKEHKEYQVIHAHIDCLSNIRLFKIATKNGIPTIIIHSRNNNHSGIIHNIMHKLNKKKIDKYTTDYFAISDLAAEWLFSEKVYKQHKYNVIGNGIDIDKFIFNKQIREKIRQELNIQEKKVIGHIGRFAEQKNHEFLIDIFNEIQNKDKNTVLLLLGDGPLKEKIQEKVNNLNLSDKVLFLGVKQNAYDYMQAMDVFLFPSLYEGLGRVLIEAQAADLPCIASEKVIPREANILDTYQSVDLQNPSTEWADRTLDALKYTERKDRREEIGQAGYDIKKVAQQLQEFYLNRY